MKTIKIHCSSNNYWISDENRYYYDNSGQINHEMSLVDFFWRRQPDSNICPDIEYKNDLYSKKEYNKYYCNSLRVAIQRAKKNFPGIPIEYTNIDGTCIKKYQ